MKKESNNKLLRSLAFVALGFAAVMSLLVIMNHLQLKQVDPVNSEIIDQLVERLSENPEDQQLRTQIREVDLLARKAYFINSKQIRLGGYLILVALSIFIIIYQLLGMNVRQQVMTDPDAPKDILGIQKSARYGITVLGIILLATALFLSFFQKKEKVLIFEKPGEELPVDNDGNGQEIEEKRIAVIETENVDSVSESVLQMAEDKNIQEIVKIKKEAVKENEPKSKTKKSEQKDKSETTKKEIKKVASFPDNTMLKKNSASFRGFNSNGIIYQSNVPTKWNGKTGQNILWKSPIPVQSYNSPIVWEDKIFLSGANDKIREVYCYSKKDGSLLWQTEIKDISGSPAKPPKTTDDTGLGAPTMTTDGSLVYAIFGTGDLVALDFNGNIVWGKNLGVPQNHYGHSSSLIMHREKLIVQYDQKSGGQVMAFKGKTGDILWSTKRKVKISWASPTLINFNGKSQIVLASDPLVVGYNPYTGKEEWSVDCMSGEVGPSICYDNGIVYAVNEYATITAIDMKDPSKILWENADILSDIPSPIASNGLLLMPTSYGLIGCFDGKTGALIWEHELDENIYSSPLLVGSKVYLMDTKGVMHIFKMSRNGYEQVAENPLGEDAVTTPAIADGRIYIRTNKFLYCIGK